MINVVGQNYTPTPCKDARPNKSKQLSKQYEEAAERIAAASELWNLIGVPVQKLPPAFRELCEQLYASKNGQPLSEFVGVCMDEWEALGGGRHPRAFVQAANRIREQERHKTQEPMRELEPEPWGAGAGIK